MRRKKGVNIGLLFATLGISLVVSMVFPAKFIVVTLSVALVISGIALCKAC